jgi:hypothetical protein
MRQLGELFNPTRAGISEVVIPPSSRFIKQTVGELRLRKRFGISVLAVTRGEQVFRDDVRTVSLRAGDTVVLHSNWRDLSLASEDKDLVVVTDIPKEEQRPGQDLAGGRLLRAGQVPGAVHPPRPVGGDDDRRDRHAADRRAEHGRGVQGDQLEDDLRHRLPDSAGLVDGFHRHRRVGGTGSLQHLGCAFALAAAGCRWRSSPCCSRR